MDFQLCLSIFKKYIWFGNIHEQVTLLRDVEVITIPFGAKTNLKTIVVSMPIRQNEFQHNLSLEHIEWLKKNYNNVEDFTINLDNVFQSFQSTLNEFNSDLAYANSRSRLRMLTLYQIAQSTNSLVVGTGNKVEDFGIGFYKTYG